MKRHSVCLLLVFATAIAVGPASACTNATAVGAFGFSYAATNGTGTQMDSVGQIVFDGVGNLSVTGTESTNGTIGTNTSTGTYTIATNCTGTATTQDTGNGHISHFKFVLDAGNKGFQLINNDAGFVLDGFGLAQGTVTCGLTGVKQTFALNLSGTGIGVGPVASVGRITLSGTGTLSGATTFNENGTLHAVSLTGTYTEASNCTGTAQVTLSGFPASNYSFVVVNSGKELLLIETDANTVVSGTMQH